MIESQFLRSAMKKITGVHPTGSRILVELLTAQEALGTNLLTGEVDYGAPQAYVLEIGPTLQDHGLKVGDRVIVQGSGVPMPNYNHSERVRHIVEYNNIKAVLDEE